MMWPWLLLGISWTLTVFAGLAVWLVRREWRRVNDGWAELAREAVISGVRAGVLFGHAGMSEEEAAGRARDHTELLSAARRVC